jgi:hypothetical protein
LLDDMPCFSISRLVTTYYTYPEPTLFDSPAVRVGRGLADQGIDGSYRVDGSDRRADRLGCPAHRRHAGAERAGPGSAEPDLWDFFANRLPALPEDASLAA